MKQILPLLALSAFAQNTSDVPAVSASASAIVQAQPDKVVLDIGVFSRAQTAQAAGSANAKQLTAVLEALRKELGPSADIKTTAYSLNPEYSHPRDGRPMISGYVARNTVEVTLKDVNAVGKVIDVATKAGANNIDSVRFMLQDEQKVRAQALREAAQKARASAEAIAAALNLRVVRVISAEEAGVGPPRPFFQQRVATMAAEAVPTPIEPGSVAVQSTVTVTLQVAQ